MFLRKVSKFIEEKKLLDRSGKHLVALSGGADSVCLLLVLHRLGYDVEAAHCNFKLRAEESDRDENFCRSLCEKTSIPFHVTHFDTRIYAEKYKISIEMAARELRYDYFERLRKDIDAADICVAHHRDDSVETVLMNVVRGTGIDGLLGIRPVNGRIIRPLLCVSRAEILDWLTLMQQPYVTDSSNLVNDVVRNKFRLDIIPLLKEINPALQDAVIRMTEVVAQAKDIVAYSVEKAVAEVLTVVHDELDTSGERDVKCISLDKLRTLPSPDYVLYSLLSPYHFSAEQVQEACKSTTSGKAWHAGNHTLAMDRGALLLSKDVRNDGKSYRIPETGKYVVGENFRLKVSEVDVTPEFKVSKERYIVHLDASKLRFPLTLRPVEQGDRFTPFGMNGSKLVSDYLTDRKRNFFQRSRQMVVVDASGKVVWLVGERTDGRFAVGADTIKCLELRYFYESL